MIPLLQNWFRERRIALAVFAFVWILVLGIPQLRVLFTVQALGSSLGFQQYPWTEKFEGDAFSTENLAQRYPDDISVLAMDAELRGSKSAVQNYDRLLRRFPNETWLIAARLRHTLGWMKTDRLAGDFSNPSGPPYTTPSPEKSTTPPNFTPQELQKAIALAQRGRKLEPDNSYYDWALMYFYMAAYRDADAYRVLAEASRKPRYDDHTYTQAQAQIAAHQKVRPLLWEEKLNFPSAMLFPQFAKYRELARLMSWQMWKEERRGQHARAITVRSDFARLCTPMMRGRNTIIAGLVSSACQAIMWSGNPQRRVRNNHMPPGMTKSSRSWIEWRARRMARHFADYARAHGRADLVPETTRTGEFNGRFHTASSAFIKSNQWYGLPPGLMSRMLALGILSHLSLAQIAGLLSLCFFVWMVTLYSQPAPMQRRDLLLSTLAGTIVAAICALLALRIASDTQVVTYFMQSPTAIMGAMMCAAVFLLAPLLGATLVPWGVTLWRMWKRRAELFVPPPRYEGESARHLTRDYLPLAITLCIWAMGAVALVCWIAALVALLTKASVWALPFGSSPGQPPVTIANPAQLFAIAAVVVSAMLYIGWLIKWRWFAPAQLRPLLHGALVWHHRTLATYIAVASVFYLLLSLAALGPRREADMHFDNYLKRGEISLLNLK